MAITAVYASAAMLGVLTTEEIFLVTTIAAHAFSVADKAVIGAAVAVTI